jgi:hypothetical protein
MGQYFVTGPDGKETGPFELSSLQAWISDGKLPAHAPVRLSTETVAVQAIQRPELAQLFGQFAQAPGMQSGTPGSGGGDFISTMVPAKNPPSLVAYYLGILSCIPVIGLPCAIIALIQGVKGVKLANSNPEAKGKTHAIVGLVLASIGLLINLVMIFGLLAIFLDGQRHASSLS